jgi:hypothetical protein
VNQKYVVVGGRLWGDKVAGFSHPGLNQPLVDALVFLSREDVCPDRKIVVIAVNKPEGKHRE